ncbi:hypothetical protein [Formosa sp. A9]|uniref:hypothetical protein n=1 Tax=Formosa sp. A9 TaxID=3442641 RepID=UPI003EC1357D
MKNQTFYLLLFVLTMFTTSCANDDDASDDNDTETTEMVCSLDMSSYSRTACCIYGNEVASPGETQSFVYSSNTDNNVFDWTIVSGSISIISGKNDKTVTVKFEDDFTSGIIKCDASGDLVCDTVIEITKK